MFNLSLLKFFTNRNTVELPLPEYDSLSATEGDSLLNLETGEVGFIQNFCDDPYDFSGDPSIVAYVIILDEFGRTSSDHWHYTDCTIYHRSEVQ